MNYQVHMAATPVQSSYASMDAQNALFLQDADNAVRVSITALPGSGKAACELWQALGGAVHSGTCPAPGEVLAERRESCDIIRFNAGSAEEFNSLYRFWLHILLVEEAAGFFAVCATLELPEDTSYSTLLWMQQLLGDTSLWVRLYPRDEVDFFLPITDPGDSLNGKNSHDGSLGQQDSRGDYLYIDGLLAEPIAVSGRDHEEAVCDEYDTGCNDSFDWSWTFHGSESLVLDLAQGEDIADIDQIIEALHATGAHRVFIVGDEGRNAVVGTDNYVFLEESPVSDRNFLVYLHEHRDHCLLLYVQQTIHAMSIPGL